MKKNLLFIACVLIFSTPVFSQEEITATEEIIVEEEVKEPESQSSVVFSGSSYNFIFSWKKKPTESHWTGLGFAFSNLKGLKGADLNSGKSYSILLNVVDYTIPLNHHWLFVSGLGLDWSRYHFKGDVGLQDIDGTTQFVPAEEGQQYKDSKLLAYYVTIPLVLEYQTEINSDKTFFIQGGMEGLIKYYSKSQVDKRITDGLKKVSFTGLNIRPLNARLILRTGFDDFSIFGYYQLFPMFEKGKGPEVYPWGLGVMLNF
jgi:hypothetical protein